MATATVTTNSGKDNSTDHLPVTVEDERPPHAYTEELIQALWDDFNLFQGEVNRRMETYRKALSNVTSDMYKDVFARIIGDDRMSYNPDSLFQGWYNPGYQACSHVKEGLDDMWFALQQARAYAKAMQRNRGQS